MTEAQDFGLAYPCDYCHAEVGEPCPPECPAMAGDTQEPYWAEVIDTPPCAEARLAAAVHRLPMGGLVGIRGTGAPDRADYTSEEWMDKLADWMTEYQAVLSTEVDELQAQVRKGIGLQIEKDVLRRMLGVDA